MNGRRDVTTVEVELERDKAEKIAQVAARGSQLARELGQQNPDAVVGFLRHYFRHVDAADIDERSVEDLLGLVASHYRAALQRPLDGSTITIRTPSMSADGWTAGGSTVVQIVTGDRPFLVDSITMEVLRQGWSIREVFHPQFLVRRDCRRHAHRGGALPRGHSTTRTPSGSPGCTWRSCPRRARESAGRPCPTWSQGLREVLELVAEAVEDWTKMTARAQETIDVLAVPSLIAGRVEEAALAQELLRWLVHNHFTFFGYREYDLVRGEPRSRRRRSRSTTGACPGPVWGSCGPSRIRPAPSTPCRSRAPGTT